MADTNGLCIEVRPSGAKVWRYRYLDKASIITLDECPSMSLQAARVERDRLRALLRGGANPAQVARIEKAAQGERAANTFGAIGLELHAQRGPSKSRVRLRRDGRTWFPCDGEDCIR